MSDRLPRPKSNLSQASMIACLSASAACVASAIPNARRASCRPSARQHFALKRHLLRASLCRKQLAERFAAWHRFTELAHNPSAAF
jgi:hypothetical protein